MQLKTLIERCEAIAGGTRPLARTLEVSPGNVAGWKAGKRACPVQQVARMGEMLGVPNVAELVGQIELARAGNPHVSTRRGVARGAVATLRTWAAAVAAVLSVQPPSERHIPFASDNV